MKNFESMMASAAIYAQTAKWQAQRKWNEFCESENGMTTIEIVLLIAVAIVAVGLLSGYLNGAITEIFKNLKGFINGSGGKSPDSGPGSLPG